MCVYIYIYLFTDIMIYIYIYLYIYIFMYILWLKMSDLPPNAVKKIRKTQPQILTCNHWPCWQAVAAAEARRLWMGWMCPQKYPQIHQQDVLFILADD